MILLKEMGSGIKNPIVYDRTSVEMEIESATLRPRPTFGCRAPLWGT